MEHNEHGIPPEMMGEYPSIEYNEWYQREEHIRRQLQRIVLEDIVERQESIDRFIGMMGY